MFIIETFIDNMKIKKTESKYQFLDSNNKVVCNISYYIYPDIKNFDWINIADVDTDPKYRGRGYAKSLMRELISDLNKTHPNMGLYLLVKTDNYPAIRLYKITNFITLKEINSDKGSYYLMYRSNGADISQLKNRNFHV